MSKLATDVPHSARLPNYWLGGRDNVAADRVVAQEIAPDSRIAYVDNDPMVLVHACALLTSHPQGRTEPGVVSCSRWRPAAGEQDAEPGPALRWRRPRVLSGPR